MKKKIRTKEHYFTFLLFFFILLKINMLQTHQRDPQTQVFILI